MVIMALDHVRDLMHVNSIAQSPTNLETTSPILFFTRWVTYLCAPTFVFLAGTSVFLAVKQAHHASEIRNFLFKRGFYLLMLEFIVVNFALFFDPGYHTLLFEVIAAIGFGFIMLGLLIIVPTNTIGIIGLLIIFCHNLISFLPQPENSLLKGTLTLLFNLGAFPVFTNKVFVMAYPPIPWLGIMLVGFAAGKFFAWDSAQRRSLFLKIGVGALVLFSIIRVINVYGDPLPWATQKDSVYTFLSFMNVAKYPPSLAFCLVTLGIMFLMLALSERAKNIWTALFSVYGRVPLFYFLAHFLFIHLLLLGLLLLQGFSWSQLEFASGTFGRPKGVASGVALWLIYFIWIGVVVVLYKPCQWFGQWKAENTYWWLKYL